MSSASALWLRRLFRDRKNIVTVYYLVVLDKARRWRHICHWETQIKVATSQMNSLVLPTISKPY